MTVVQEPLLPAAPPLLTPPGGCPPECRGAAWTDFEGPPAPASPGAPPARGRRCPHTEHWPPAARPK